MTDLNVEGDVEATEATEGELSRLSNVVESYRAAVRTRERLERELKEAKEDERKLSEETIPAMMDEVGMSELSLADGTRVAVEDFTRASIAKKDRDAAHDWLEQHGFGDLIKARLTANGGRGEVEQMRELTRLIAERGDYAPSLDESVHPQTLMAFVREQRAAGTELPHDLLGIYEGRKTKLKEN